MLGSVHEYPLVIREQHLDTFGHVNNAKYLEILEEARWDLISRNGYGLEEVLRRRIGPTILEINLKFQRGAARTTASRSSSGPGWIPTPGKIGRVGQEIRDPDGDLFCEALFTIGLFDVVARKLILPTPEWLRALGLTEGDLG